VANLALEAARNTRADVQRSLELNVKQQVLAAELAKRALAFASDAQTLTTDTLRLAATRFKAGAVSEVDVARAETQKLEAEQAADIARQNLETATYALAYLLGYSGEQPGLEVADDLLRGEEPASLAANTHEALLAVARAHRPDLAAAASQVERARASVRLARRLALPDFGPSLQYSAEGRGQSAIQPPTVTLGVTATVPLLYRYRGEVAKARSDLHTQEIARQKIESQIAADVGAAWSAWSSSRQRLARMRERLLDRAARARDLVHLQYEKGAVSLFEFLDAQRTLIATQNESLSTLNDYWNAVFQLEQATATELRK